MATWQEITGTRTIDCAEPPFIDVRIDFMAAVGADLPALGLTYIELRDGDLGRVEMWRGDDRNGEWPLAGGFRRVPVPQAVP